jgi:hypothetical protein
MDSVSVGSTFLLLPYASKLQIAKPGIESGASLLFEPLLAFRHSLILYYITENNIWQLDLSRIYGVCSPNEHRIDHCLFPHIHSRLPIGLLEVSLRI